MEHVATFKYMQLVLDMQAGGVGSPEEAPLRGTLGQGPRRGNKCVFPGPKRGVAPWKRPVPPPLARAGGALQASWGLRRLI